MKIYPKDYNKQEFLDFLNKINVSENIVSKFNELPETVMRSDTKYELYIHTVWYGEEGTHYTFELNYYSKELIEYLFSSKVFDNVEVSINNLLCDLINAKYLKRDETPCR